MRFAWLLLIVLVACGCSAGVGGEMRLARLGDGKTLSQRFDEAYITRSEHGDYDIVLVADTAAEHVSRRRDNTLAPAPAVPVRHVVHLRVFWRPLRGLRVEDTATSNAAIDWYVLTPGAREGEDLLRYRGSGLVAVYPGDDGAAIAVRNVRIEPQVVRGRLADPIGRASVTGSVQARWDEQFIANKLAEMRALVDAQAAAR